MAPHSSTLAWKIPWMEEPGGLQSTGLQRVRHDRVTNTFTLSRLQRTGVQPLTSMWGGGSIKLQITVKTVVGVTEWNMGLKIQEKNVIGWKVLPLWHVILSFLEESESGSLAPVNRKSERERGRERDQRENDLFHQFLAQCVSTEFMSCLLGK